jgi:steroid delta-isomerase-like uncharacterized protein
MREDAEKLVRAYYDRFNAKDVKGFLALLTGDVIHDINQGRREHGLEAFARFMERMNRCYDEQITELVVMANDAGRAAAEFVVVGKYVSTDTGLPAARGQSYRLPAGAFFDVKDGKVARISNTYNLHDWLKQVVI